jgi:orotidine-5'-phosphate decarboxylase
MEDLSMIIYRLISRIEALDNPTALGLDTRIEQLPPSFGKLWDLMIQAEAARLVLAYNRALIDGLADIVPCIKIQAACYEMLGIPGMQAMADTMVYARAKGMMIIADVKRNDIGPSSQAYAMGWLAGGEHAAFDADFATVNPYLGVDGIEPFLQACRQWDRGIFVLVKTSNPSSAEFQDLVLQDGRTVFEAVADRVSAWGQDRIGSYGYSAVGAVVGATHPRQGAALRRRMPHTFFLLPGYGAQGAGGAELAGMFDRQGRGGVVNASRSLLMAWKKADTEDFVQAARDEALAMRADIRQALAANVK